VQIQHNSMTKLFLQYLPSKLDTQLKLLQVWGPAVAVASSVHHHQLPFQDIHLDSVVCSIPVDLVVVVALLVVCIPPKYMHPLVLQRSPAAVLQAVVVLQVGLLLPDYRTADLPDTLAHLE
jgi:hypothetical protein